MESCITSTPLPRILGEPKPPKNADYARIARRLRLTNVLHRYRIWEWTGRLQYELRGGGEVNANRCPVLFS